MKTSEQTDNHTTEAHYACAFAELTALIENTIFDLVRLYRERLVQLGVSSPCVHSTRLKDHILSSFPELQAFKDGRDILLISNEDIGTALQQVCENVLAQAA